MTRTELLAQQEAKAKAKRDKEAAVYRTKQKARLAEEKRRRRKRHVLVGKLVDTAGLFVLTDADLAGLFAALAPLLSVPHPGAVLEVLLSDGQGAALVSGGGHGRDCVSCGPYGANLNIEQ